MPISDILEQPLAPAPHDDPHMIRLGLVLSGTVSAGAWTAGVLDMLFEALDAWEAAKAAGAPVPRHRVRLDIIGGASGGGVNAAIAARAATCDFPHVRADGAGAAANPFWRVWVERLDAAHMLTTTDLAGEDAIAASLLNGRAIDDAVAALLDWRPGTAPGVARRATPRAWLADPLRVLLTLTNLRGVPYRIAFQPGAPGDPPRASQFVSHADHAIFAFPAAAGRGAAALGLRGDEFQVDPDFATAAAAWQRLGQFAAATGAFPLGFPPRRLARRRSDYDFRGIVLPGGPDEPSRVARLLPAWPTPPPAGGGDYVFDCVDGGTLNNQPLDLVRAALNGLGKPLERDGTTAKRMVLLIDPLAADAPPLPMPAARPDLFGVLGGLINTWLQQARYSTADLLLALDPSVASRFLLTAGRTSPNGPRWGAQALATAGAEAFLGFFDRRLRVHDFLLGRHNARAFLRKHFSLPASNPVFGGFGATAAAVEFLVDGEPGQERRLPIIPIADARVDPTTAPAWPPGFALPADLEALLAKRLQEVVQTLASGHAIGFPFDRLVFGAAAKKVGASVEAALAAGAARQLK